MRAILYSVFAALVLAGCETAPSLQGASDLTRDLRQNKADFVLNQEVTIPSGRARLFLQDGAVVGGRNLYRPHCIIEIDSIDHTGFLVTAETFDVVRIQRSTVQIAMQGDSLQASTNVASGPRRNRSRRFHDSKRFHDGYHFWLASEMQPAVRRLTCYGVFARPIDLRPPTLPEINAALGQVGTIRVEEASEL